MKKILLSASLACASGVVFAQETANVMPEHIFRARAVQVMGNTITNRFDENERPVELLAPLNRSISTADMAAQNPELKQLYDALNTFQPGLGDSLFQSDLSAKSSINFQQTVFALEYGLWNNLTLGIIVPTGEMDIDASFNALTLDNIEALKTATAGTALPAYLDQAASGKPDVNTFAKAIFTDKGYKVPHRLKIKGLGNIETGFKYQPIKNDWWTSSIQSGFRWPTTSHAADPTELLDKGLGDKHTDLGLYLFNDFNPVSSVTIDTAVKMGFPFASHQKMAFLHKGESDLPNLNDASAYDTVRRDLGMTVEADAGVTWFMFNKTVNLYGEYQFAYKGADKFNGSHADLDYAAATANSETRSHRLESGIGYSTIPQFIAKTFAVPFEVKYGYNHMFRGLNTANASYHRFNLLLYF